MNLNQRIMEICFNWVINHGVLWVGLALLVLSIWDYYNNYLRINEKTDNIDLMERYVQIRLLRRYNGRQPYFRTNRIN
jgi:hypothetical protein